MLGRQPKQCRGSMPSGAGSAVQASARPEMSAVLSRYPSAPAAAPTVADASTAARSPGRWALRVSELTKTVSTSSPLLAAAAAAVSARPQAANGFGRPAGLSNGLAHRRNHEPPSSASFSSPEQQAALVEQALGSSASIWRTKRESENENRGSREQLRQRCRQMLSDGTAKPSDLAYFVAQFAKLNDFESALQLMDHLSKDNQTEALEKINQRIFMDSAKLHKQGAAAVAFLHTLPKRFHDIRLYNMALQTCANNRDMARALEVMELVEKHRVAKDVKLLTTMINVYKSVGNAEQALRSFKEMKATGAPLDGQVYGTVVSACAEAMLRELSVVHERKDQYVLMERAFQLVAEAVEGGQVMPVPVYNSLLVCAGRSGQLGRAFEVLDYMSAQKLSPNERTYGSLMEACVQAGKQQLALKVFSQAVREGYQVIQIYTQAVSACKIDGCVDLDKAMEIYALMQRSGVSPDKKFYAALMAVAGKAGRVDLVLEHLQSVAEDRMVMSQTLANGLMYAAQRDLSLMRKVYGLCAQHGVYPELSQFNRLMDWYTEQGRFGEMVSLVCDMVGAGLLPNINTYRIIFNACQRAGQSQLALEVYAAMKAKKVPILQEKFARVIFFTLLKTCQNQILFQSSAQFEGKPAPWKPHTVPSVRMAEAEKLITALRSTVGSHSASTTGRATSSPNASAANGHGQGPLGTGLLALAPESINWQQQALMLYRDYMSTGYKPHLMVLDVVLRCLRLRLRPDEDGASAAAAAAGVSSAGASPDQLVSNGMGGAHIAGPSTASSGPLGLSGTSPLGLSGHHHHPTALGALALGLPGSFGPAATSRRGNVPIDFGSDSTPVSRQPWESLGASNARDTMGSGLASSSNSSSSGSKQHSASGMASSSAGASASSTSSMDAPAAVTPAAASTSDAGAHTSQEAPTPSISEIPNPKPAPGSEASKSRYEMPFDRRALGLLEEAMHKGFLPSVKGVEEGPMTFDLRSVPPTVAEVMLVSVLAMLDKRAAKTGRCQVFHNVSFLVPAEWDPDHIMWPSYLERMYSGGRSKEGLVSKTAQVAGQEGAEEGGRSRGNANAEDAHASSSAQHVEESEEDEGEAGGDVSYEQLEGRTRQSGQDEASASASSSNGHSLPHGQAQTNGSHGNGHASTAAAAAATMPYHAAGALHGMPFTAADAAEAVRSGSPQAESIVPVYAANHRTSLALLSACKRMKVFYHGDPAKGSITLTARELSRWLINRRQFVSRQHQAHLQGDGAADEASTSDSSAARRRSRQRDGRAPGSVGSSSDTLSSDEEELNYPAQAGAGGTLIRRPKHRPQRRIRVKRPSSRLGAPGAEPSGSVAVAPVPVPVPVVLSAAAPAMLNQTATVDNGMTLGGGIQISVPPSSKSGVQARK